MSPLESKQRRVRWHWSILTGALVCAGCLFHDAPPPRYFSPPSTLTARDESPADPTTDRPIRLRRVRSSAYLTEQIVWRDSDVERGFYEQRRWTDFPSRYLERAMAAALDDAPGIRRVAAGGVATLDLELVSFDEVLTPTHVAEVTVLASLRGSDQHIIFERNFSAQQPIANADGAAAARAMGTALDEVVQQIASQVAAQAPALPAKPAKRKS
jgi:ABC-type uncharacterized transport system auxiliary subunit